MPSFNPPPVPEKPKNRGPINVDDIVVGKGHGENLMTEYPEGEDPNQLAAQHVDKLSDENRKNASQLVEAFGEEIVAKLFSKTWQTKEDALNEIEDLTVNSNQMS